MKFGNRHLLLLFLFLPFIAAMSCDSGPSYYYDYGTKSDSARYYFLKGWEEILDNGRWTESETAFRDAVDFDPDWLLGKSMVGRITRNLEERERLLEELEANKHLAGPDERMLLDVNLLSLKAANNRGRGIPNSPEFNQQRRELAEKNFGAFVRKYPEDAYFKAEYIEFLHANHGPQVAIDSMLALVYEGQMGQGFYLSYGATLRLELGDIRIAQNLLDMYKTRHIDPTYTTSWMMEAQIAEAKDSLKRAKALVDHVVDMDPNHLIAIGMQNRLAAQLKEQANGEN